MHLETIGYATTAPSTGAAAAALAGDSLTIKNALPGSKIYLLAHVADKQAAGSEQVIHSSGHDTTRGYRVRAAASEVRNLLPWGFWEELKPQELLSITTIGSATGGDVETGLLWVWYENLPGIAGHFLTAEEVWDKVIKLLTVQMSLTTTTGPNWTGAEALNAESDLLLPNRNYALIGATCDVECAGIGVRSPDFGNVRVAVPGHDTAHDITSSWFTRLSEQTGLACVPVLNSGNRANTLIDAAQDENATAVTASLILGLLSE